MKDSLAQQLQTSIPDTGERIVIFLVGCFLLLILGLLVYFKMNEADDMVKNGL